MARRFVLDVLGPASPSLRDDVSVMVSELATNAILYAATTFEIRVERNSRRLRVEVVDIGAGMPMIDRFPPPSRPHGRGLMIVERLADAWGIEPPKDGLLGKSVWFSVDLNGR